VTVNLQSLPEVIRYSRIANVEWWHESKASRRRGGTEALRLS
jgi:hypothetical protein